MKICLYSRPNASHDPGEVAALLAALKRNHIETLLSEPFAEKLAGMGAGADLKTFTSPAATEADMLLCYGGDGTFLDGVRMLDGLPMPVLGINSGRMGFLANIPAEGIDQAVEDIAKGCYSLRRSAMLTVAGDFPENTTNYVAFNEFTIQRASAAMISIEVCVDGEMVATYWGDGAMISTPAGSTAYSLSVGGPIIAPECNCFVLSPIAPHNLTMRPVVIPDSSKVSFRVESRDGYAGATIDNLSFRVESGSVFEMGKSNKELFLVQLHNNSFYHTLSMKMMWGIDHRNR